MQYGSGRAEMQALDAPDKQQAAADNRSRDHLSSARKIAL